MLKKIFFIFVCLFTNTVFASCPTGYTTPTHNIDLDYNISTTLPELIEPTQQTPNNDIFVLSEMDGTCTSGYEPYVINDNISLFAIETPTLCPEGQYLNTNGTCTNYATCSGNYKKYNYANNTVIEQNENDECDSGYELYTDLTRCDASTDYQCVDLPTIINLNWYDRDTIIATNTCRYGQPITLPPEPTRPGYIFSGWRLRTEQNSGE